MKLNLTWNGHHRIVPLSRILFSLTLDKKFFGNKLFALLYVHTVGQNLDVFPLYVPLHFPKRFKEKLKYIFLTIK